MKFYLDLDVRIFFQLFKKIFFRSKFFGPIFFWIEHFLEPKKNRSKKIEKKISPTKIDPKKIRFQKFWIQLFFSQSIYFFGKVVEKKSDHQVRSKISLRIDWEHSQPMKTTLERVIPKYS